MNNEVIFKRNFTSIILSAGCTILFSLFILLINFILLKPISPAIILAVLIIVILGICATWSLVLQRLVRYYNEEISFHKIFQKRYMKWDEIELASINGKVVKLESKDSNLKIFLAEYKEPEKVIKFIESKILKAHDKP